MRRIAEYVLVALGMTLAAVALGDGMMVSARPEVAAMEAGQKAVLIDDGASETILFQVTYRGTRDECAWVVPVPGKPGPHDVDEGSQWFLDYVEGLTSPTVVTEGPESHGEGMSSSMGGPSAEGKAGGMSGHEGPTVIEDERLDVGPYQVSVLEATGKGVLGEWLRTHGFQMPPVADRELDGYVGRGWYFVATRVKPGQAGSREAKISQGDLPPLAVRFPRPRKIVYPLAISRASVQGRCVVDLTILAPTPVDCDEAPLHELPQGNAGRGSIWAVLDAATMAGKSSVLLAAIHALPLPAPAWCMKKYAKPAAVNWSAMWATRMWLRPDQSTMVDLHLSPKDFTAGRRTMLLQIHRGVGSMPRHTLRNAIVVAVAVSLVLLFLRFTRAGRGGAAVVMILATVGVAWAGFTSTSAFEAYDRAAEVIIAAVARFHDMTGCFPAEVRDLAAPQPPTTALDASGNEVAVGALQHWAPLLDEIPKDPAGGSPDSWIVDLAAPGYVSSKAFALRVNWGFVPQPAPLPGPRSGSPYFEHMSSPRAYLAPVQLKATRAVALAYPTRGAPYYIWLRPDPACDEQGQRYAPAEIVAEGPDANSLVDLHPGGLAPAGMEAIYCSVEIVKGEGTSATIGSEPLKGLPVAVTLIKGTGSALAAISAPRASISLALALRKALSPYPGPPYYGQPPPPPYCGGPSSLERVDPDRPPQHLADVRALRGLADAGDGSHVFVVSVTSAGSDQPTKFGLSLLDVQTGKLASVAGLTDLVGPADSPWVVARDGYAWVVARAPDGRSRVLTRVTAKGAVDRFLTSSTAPWPIAPGPGGEALVVVSGEIPGCPGNGDRIVRLGKSASVLIAGLQDACLDEPPDPATRRRGLEGLAWPPEAMKDAAAIVVARRESEDRVVLVRRSFPHLFICAQLAGVDDRHLPGMHATLNMGDYPVHRDLAVVVRGIMPVTEAPSGWLASVMQTGQRNPLDFQQMTAEYITSATLGGRTVAYVGGFHVAAPAQSAAPVLDCGLANFALVFEPVEKPPTGSANEPLGTTPATLPGR